MIVEHIGVAVKNADSWKKIYTNLFPDVKYKEETVSEQGVKITFVKAKNLKIELMEPLSEDSTIYKFIEKHGEGFHHIAFMVDDVNKTMEKAEISGLSFIYDKPKPGAEGLMVNFLSLKSSNGMLTEFCYDNNIK